MKKAIFASLILAIIMLLAGIFFLLIPQRNTQDANAANINRTCTVLALARTSNNDYVIASQSNSNNDAANCGSFNLTHYEFYIGATYREKAWKAASGNVSFSIDTAPGVNTAGNRLSVEGDSGNESTTTGLRYFTFSLAYFSWQSAPNEYVSVTANGVNNKWVYCGLASSSDYTNNSLLTTDASSKTYTFNGKDGVGGTKNGGGLTGTFYAIYRKIYTLKYDANGGSNAPSSSKFYAGVSTKLSNSKPTRTNYDFVGWKLINTDTNATIVSSCSAGSSIITSNAKCNITAEAIWRIKTTSITLDKNNGSGGSSSVTATYGSAMPTITVPTRTGYTFNGYFISESSNNGTGTKYYNSNGTSARAWDVNATTDTLYAGWTIESYTINYDANGGSVSPDSDTVNYNERITLPTPTRAGYTFNGWRYGGTNYTSSYTVPDFGASGTEVTFEAQWTKESYTIKYDANGGTATRTSDDVDYGQSITLPSATRAGYTFNGWRYGGTNYTGSYTVPDFGNNGATVTFTAQWTIESYTIKYDANGGTATRTSDDVDYGQSITLPSATRTGYTFNGWRYNSTNYTGSYTVPDFGDNGATVTFTAQWTKESYTIKYDANGGSVSPNSQTVNYGDSITLPTPTRTGYTFIGWEYDGNTYSGSYIVPDFGNNGATVTFTAQWSQERYTINYNANSGSVSPTSDSVNYGESITLPTPTRTGYTFNGWRYGGTNYTGSYTVPDFGNNGATVTFTAQWTAKTYNNTFNANGGKFSDGATTKSFTMRYNTQDYSMLETYIPTQAGYTFAGWYDSSNTQVYNSQGQSIAGTRYFNSSRNWIYDGTVTFYAHWNANRYTVTFDEAGGSSVSDISNYTIESTISFPSTTKAGYDFVNWQVTRADGNWTNGATFNANTTTTDKYGNVTLTAQWDYHTYTVTLNPNGGEVSPTSIRVTYQSTYGSLPTPTRDGYVFKGWYTSATSGTQILSTTRYTSTQDTTIYAQWQETWANHASDALTSEDGYYLVSSEEDLARVSYLFNCTDRTDVQTMKFKLTKNLDMSDYTWLPIGSQSRQFRGTFEGNGHIISGLNTYYNSSISSTYTNIGLFGYVNGATIQNLYLRDTDMRGGSNVGGLIGYATGNTQVTSCAFDGDITANSNGGSIVGLGATSVIVSNCTVFSSNTTANTNGMARGCSVRSLVYITNDIKDYIGTDFSNYVFVEGMPAPVPTGLSWLAQGGEPCDLADIEEWAEN